MKVTRELRFHAPITGLNDRLAEKLSDLGIHASRLKSVAGAIATLIMLNSDSGQVLTSAVDAAWQRDPEEHLQITLSVTTVE